MLHHLHFGDYLHQNPLSWNLSASFCCCHGFHVAVATIPHYLCHMGIHSWNRSGMRWGAKCTKVTSKAATWNFAFTIWKLQATIIDISSCYFFYFQQRQRNYDNFSKIPPNGIDQTQTALVSSQYVTTEFILCFQWERTVLSTNIKLVHTPSLVNEREIIPRVHLLSKLTFK